MNVIDLKRASNIGIIISHFKLSFSEIREALLELDEEVLTVERLLALKSAFPNDEERKKLAAFKGDKSSLSRPEQFLLEMIVVPRLESRVEYLLLKQQFSTLISELSDVSDTMCADCLFFAEH
jgi:diaphanous 1